MRAFEKVFEKGEVLFKEGDPPTEMYLIKSGSVEVFKGKGDTKKVLGVLSKGEFLGEMGVLDGRPRSATAVALERTSVMVMDEKSFRKVIEEDPMIGSLIITLIKRLRSADKALMDCHKKLKESDGER